MRLGAYTIGGRAVSQLESYNTEQLDGNPPFMVANTLPDGYEDITGIENFHRFGSGIVGTAYGFRDWKCLQREIKALIMEKTGDDVNTNWNELDEEEKVIACRYILSRILPEHFASVITDPEERMNVSIQYDLNNKEARGSWTGVSGRVQILRVYLFGKIGATNALEAFYDVVKDGLIELYEGGIEGTLEDGNLGINDFLLARAGTFYSSDGLKKRNYPVIDGSGDDLEDVANAMVNIVNNGIY